MNNFLYFYSSIAQRYCIEIIVERNGQIDFMSKIYLDMAPLGTMEEFFSSIGVDLQTIKEVYFFGDADIFKEIAAYCETKEWLVIHHNPNKEE